MEKQVSRYIKSNKVSINKNIFFVLIALYSLLPGIYKVLDNQLMMLGSIPIVLYLLYKTRKQYVIYKKDLIFIFLFIYILLQSLLWVGFLPVNDMGLAMGLFLNVFPMLGFFISRGVDFDFFSEALIKVVIIHCIIGILLYPFFGIYQLLPADIVSSLSEGILYGRMTSVSGSLGFSSLMLMGFVLSFFLNKKYLPLIVFCLVFNAQRSAWVAAFLAMCIHFFFLSKRFELKKVFGYIFFISIFVLLGGYFVVQYIDFDIDFLLSRFQTVNFDEASSERSNQWENGIENFMQNPLGVGVGQVGQVAARYTTDENLYHIVSDGDYFRILSEYGIFSIFLYGYIILSLIKVFIFHRVADEKVVALIAIICGFLVQMIGSNISEFYFTNFLYWMFFGYYFKYLTKNKL